MNFKYLESFPKLNKLCSYCKEAEELAVKYPSSSCTSARKAMEFMVKMLYGALIGQEYSLTVFDMLTDVNFTSKINDDILINSIHYIRKIGNAATHGEELSKDESLKVLEELHFVTGEFCIFAGVVADYPEFKSPEESADAAKPAPANTINFKEKVIVEPELIAEFAPRMRGTKFQVHWNRDEEENKKLFLRASLREAGWPIVNKQNQSLPASAGINMILDDGDSVDYVLYGRDNKPLAIVEYTTTSNNIVEGRIKAKEKADKIEAKYGYRPTVYYTNGYYNYVIDPLGYAPRRVFDFHSIEELELLKQRTTERKDISNPEIDESIAGREYQKKAITAACKAFTDMRRRSLLVMATGTGKTRVSIALSDVLLKAGWVKNILFLADRTSLVRQAHKNFTKLLPSVTTSVYSGTSINKDPNARIIFSTYQTMINLINDDTREFTIGRFDLIIIDEAHRSIFSKYSALFNYFDSLMIGLTATPRAQDDKSTYHMFQLNNGEPDFAYELDEAIGDGYLVGFSIMDKTTDTLKRGICYDDLSAEEKQAYEETFSLGSTEVDFTGTIIDPKMFRQGKVINLGTIDVMLCDLMKNGLKIEGGDKLGKTIIFASSHVEAEKIVERFNEIFKDKGSDFCKLIDSQIVNNLSLIDNFGERDQMPQIAVSVDMMDTGVDVPDVLNLVFFKEVKSKIKFLQMIGRGTRLSQDVFGPGNDKKGFLIFDYYDNFRFFKTHHTWSTVDSTSNGVSLTITPQSELINQSKLGILDNLIRTSERTPFEENYKKELISYFVDSVRGLCNDHIEVQYNMAIVSKYRTEEQWYGFTQEKIYEIEKYILPLLPSSADSMKVKAFDLMIYVIENQIPKRMEASKDIRKIKHGFGNVGKKIDAMIEELKKLKTIPDIQKKEKLLNQMHCADLLFDNFSLEICESVRKELRDLMDYIPNQSKAIVVDYSDTVINGSTLLGDVIIEKKTYDAKVREYIEKGSPALAKIRNLDALTQAEKDELDNVFKVKLGNEADFASWAKNQPLLVALRVQVGISDEAIDTKFGSFLNSNTLTLEQLLFMKNIISFARENGDVLFADLQNESPFCDVDIMALFGANISYVKTLVNGLHKPIL